MPMILMIQNCFYIGRCTMKKRAIVLGLSVLAVAGSIFVGASQGSVSVSGDGATAAPAPAKVDGNDPAIQAIVREEVAKQLQPAVQKEVRRQLDAILYRAQQEQIARAVELKIGVTSPKQIELVTGDQDSAEYAKQIRAVLDGGKA